ncbi:MAG: hypothetical protein IJX28_02385 [Clostridia bacterium]|nr:hypothetical protein [Clostridia bacterium]
MKKMDFLFRTTGIFLALFLLFSLNACKNTSLDDNGNSLIDPITKSANLVERSSEYTLSSEGNVLTLRKNDSVLVSNTITSMATAWDMPHVSTRFLLGNENEITSFLSTVLVRKNIVLHPTTFEEIGFDPMAANRYYVSFNTESPLYIMFQTDGQMLVHNLSTDELYISDPGVVDVQTYYQFIHGQYVVY